MKTLYKSTQMGDYYSKHIEFVEHNNKKFRLTVRIANGDPCGFKFNQCIEVMTLNGEFAQVIDAEMMGIYDNDYAKSKEELTLTTTNIVKEFKKFIEKVY